MHDAIVIGAGLSGLVCARRLVEAGARVVLVDARDRVGGRLATGDVAGALVDLGGQWLTAGQDRLANLATELGIATFEHARRGRAIVDEGGGVIAKLRAAFAQRRALRTIETRMRAVPDGEPMRTPDAATLDAQSLKSWLDASVRDELARARIRMHADLVFACEPAELSLLAYFATLGATGGFRPGGPDLPGGGREHRFAGGAQRLALALVERIGGALADVRLAWPVRSIEDASGGVVARGHLGELRARRVVLAMPPALVRELAIELPAAQRAYLDGVRTGAVVKCFAAYARPFWRERGLSGEAYLPEGSVRATVEIAGEPPVLLAFVVGAAAARWARRDEGERREEVLATLARHFGDEAARPIGYLEQNWAAERWSAGCVAATAPGVLAHGARWREPVGNVHFAGTETAVRWPGYMDGAIEAGERAASEVIAVLAR